MTVQIGGRGVGGNVVAATEVAKPQTFDGILLKVSGFVVVYKLYIRIRLRELSVKE